VAVWLKIGVNHLGWETDGEPRGVFRCKVCGKRAPVHFYDFTSLHKCARCGLLYKGAGTAVLVDKDSVDKLGPLRRRKANKMLQREASDYAAWQRTIVSQPVSASRSVVYPVTVPAQESKLVRIMNPKDEDAARWEEIELPDKEGDPQ